MNLVKSEGWGSRLGLILAMAGNAVGLGNFLRFPVQAVQNGGGAFIIPYLVCFLIMGIPLLWVEWAMGRFGGRYGHHSPPFIMASMDKRQIWKYVGVFGIFTNIGVAAYYSYIESWTLSYSLRSVSGWFHGKSEMEILNHFENYISMQSHFLGIPNEAVFFFVIVVLLNTFILSKGLKGIEKMAKVGMPLLIVFAIFLVVNGLTNKQGASADYNPWAGLDFLWNPQFDTLLRPKVWLAAAGQIFFTLSVGMGTIHCYASYLKSKEDIALNAVTTGFTNEFVEIVLGSMIVVPIAAGFLGLDWIKDHISFGAAFQTMPFLFDKWGPILGSLSGLFWFGLLFFAGITSSLAMGMPWISFLTDEFKWNQKHAAYTFGLLVFVLGLPTVLYYNSGVFNEYDYWAGTVSLVIFALLELILFAWVFGIERGWEEINLGADIRIPKFYGFVIRYITPLLLLFVLIGSVITPEGNNWYDAMQSLFNGNGWPFDSSSMIKQIMNAGLHDQMRSANSEELASIKHKIKLINGARILLLTVFAGIAILVYYASRKHKTKTLKNNE